MCILENYYDIFIMLLIVPYFYKNKSTHTKFKAGNLLKYLKEQSPKFWADLALIQAATIFGPRNIILPP